jgi:predicted ArsR family transcriptional regulator
MTNPKHLPEHVKECTPTAKLLWVYLRTRNHKAYPLRSLADALGISLEACRNGLDELEAVGALTRERNSTNPAIMHIHQDPPQAPPKE